MKGWLHEADKYINTKFDKLSTKLKNNGTEEENK